MPKIPLSQSEDINLNPILFKVLKFLTEKPDTALGLEKRKIGTKRANNYYLLTLLKASEYVKIVDNPKHKKIFRVKYSKLNEEFLKICYGTEFNNYKEKYIKDLIKNDILKNIIKEFIKKSHEIPDIKTLNDLFKHIKDIIIKSYIVDYFNITLLELEEDNKSYSNLLKKEKDMNLFISFLRDIIMMSRDKTYLQEQNMLNTAFVNSLSEDVSMIPINYKLKGLLNQKEKYDKENLKDYEEWNLKYKKNK